MLEDFIKANGLQARVLPYAAKGSLIKCRLFSSGKENILAIFLAKDKLSGEKIKKALAIESLKAIEDSLVEEITGYSPGFIPPISVYGLRVLVDLKILEKPKARCLVEEKKTLEISPKEILEANEEALESDITL